MGKLLGPKGNSLRRLQEETMCKMTVLGRNSMRDRVKEEELRNSKDPKYSHLNSDRSENDNFTLCEDLHSRKYLIYLSISRVDMQNRRN